MQTLPYLSLLDYVILSGFYSVLVQYKRNLKKNVKLIIFQLLFRQICITLDFFSYLIACSHDLPLNQSIDREGADKELDL